jgi:hypothetical protein
MTGQVPLETNRVRHAKTGCKGRRLDALIHCHKKGPYLRGFCFAKSIPGRPDNWLRSLLLPV